MAKYSAEIVKEICELVSTGRWKVADICKKVGIGESTYFEWKDSKPDFLESLKDAEKKRLRAWNEMANSGMAKLLDGFEYDEETIEYIDDPMKPGNAKIKSKKVTKKFIMPNPTTVIFAKTNLDPDNFKHKQEIQHSGEMSITWNEEKTYNK